MYARLSQVRGGLVFSIKDQQYEGIIYSVIETDDSCDGTYYTITQKPSNLANNNTGSYNITTPQWPDETADMEAVSDDFHESLRNCRVLVPPDRKEDTLSTLCGLTALHYTLVGLSGPWTAKTSGRASSMFIRRELGLDVSAPHFATDVVRKGSEADPRNFTNYM